MKDKIKKYTKPGGLPKGIFKISIDDGYVEWEFRIRPKTVFSIYDIHRLLCWTVGARITKGKIRTKH